MVSCTDDFEKKNTNPDKIYEVNIQNIFPGTVYKTMNYLSELNYNHYSWMSRYVTLFSSPSDQSNNSGVFTNLYVNVLRDLKMSEKAFTNKTGFENRLQIVKTWQAYVYSVIVGSWGGMPMSGAFVDSPNEMYKYDSEIEMYRSILEMLKTATENFNPGTIYAADLLNPDPIFPTSVSSSSSDISKWRKFANTLRLDIALRIQNLDPALAEATVKECMAHEDWLISSNDDAVKCKWGSNLNADVSYYYNRVLKTYVANPNITTYPRIDMYFFIYLKSYNDPRMSAFATPSDPAAQFVIKDTLTRETPGFPDFRDSIAVTYKVPYLPYYDGAGVPQGWTVGIDPNSPGGTGTYQNPYSGVTIADKTWAFININFLKQDATFSILNGADAFFLKAEAKILYGVGKNSAEQYYNDGIEASMLEYGFTTTQATQYKSQQGIKWDTNGKGVPDFRGFYYADINGQGGDENHLEQIYKQRYIADFFNGFAACALERRTRSLRFPPFFYNAGTVNEGSNGLEDFMPERLLYPFDEMSKNPTAYYNAITNLQANSPSPNGARWGDNFFTLLGISKPNPDKISNWETGKIRYNTLFLQKWYGKTQEEFIQRAKISYPGITDSTSLKQYIGYTAKYLKTYNP